MTTRPSGSRDLLGIHAEVQAFQQTALVLQRRVPGCPPFGALSVPRIMCPPPSLASATRSPRSSKS